MVTQKYYKNPVEVNVEVVNNGIIEGRSTVKLQRDDRLLDKIQTANIAPNEVTSVQVSADDLQEADVGETIEYRVVTENASSVVSVEVFTIPDTLVTRPQDDDTAVSRTSDTEHGIRIETSQEWPSIGARLSANGSNRNTAKLYRTSDQTVLETVDITTVQAGETFTFDDVNLQSNTQYDIIVTNDAEWSSGFLGSSSFPYTSSDGNLEIISGVYNGNSDPSAHSILEAGDVGFSRFS